MIEILMNFCIISQESIGFGLTDNLYTNAVTQVSCIEYYIYKWLNFYACSNN